MKIIIKAYIPLLLSVFIFCFSACTDNGEGSSKKEIVNPGKSSPYSCVLSGSFSYGEAGLYSLESNISPEDKDTFIFTAEDESEYFTLLNFTDTGTGTKTVLCNKPDCSHKDKSCNAYFPSRFTVKQEKGKARFPVLEASGYVFIYDGKLYVLDSFGDLIMMNKDGSEHKKLLSLDSKYTVSKGFLYKDSIYLFVRYLPEYDGSKEQEFTDEDYNIAVLDINLKTGKCREVFSFKTEPETECLGIYDNKVYFFYRSPNKLISAKNQQEVDSEENNHDVSLFYYDLSEPQREYIINNILSFETDNVAFYEDSVFYHNRREEKIVKLKLSSGDRQDILTGIGGYIEIYTPVKDDKLYFMKNNQLNNAFSEETQINEKYCVDLISGETEKINDMG